MGGTLYRRGEMISSACGSQEVGGQQRCRKGATFFYSVCVCVFVCVRAYGCHLTFENPKWKSSVWKLVSARALFCINNQLVWAMSMKFWC